MISSDSTPPILASLTSFTAFGVSNIAAIEQGLRLSSLAIGVVAGLIGVIVGIKNLRK